MKHLILSILIICNSTVIAQKRLVEPPKVPFQSVKFDDFVPTWSLDIYDASLIRNDTFDGYNEFDLVFTFGDHSRDGKLYKSHTIRNYDWMGFRVNCIDLATGELLWVRNITYDDYGRQHLPAYQTFDDDGNLVIIGFRKAFPYDPKEKAWLTQSEKPSKIFRMVIDAIDGSVLSYHSPDEGPDFAYARNLNGRLWSFFGLDHRGSVEFLLMKYLNTPHLSTMVRKGYIHQDGKFELTDSLVFSPNDWTVNRTKYVKKDSKYYCLERSTSDGKKYIVAMDTLLREVSRVDISHFKIENNYIELFQFTDEFMLFGQAFPSPNNYNLRYFVVDYNGNLINTMDFKDDFFRKYYDANITFDSKYNKLLVVGFGDALNQTKNGYESFVDIIHYDGKKYETHKRIKISQVNLVWTPWQVLYVDDDQLIFDCRVGAYFYDENATPTIQYSHGNNAMNVTAVSRSALGILSSTQEEEVVGGIEKHAYPNPSSGSFNLSLDGFLGNIDLRIFDMSGRNVYVDTDINSGDISLDLSALPVGIYAYRVYQGSKLLTLGQWIRQ